MFPVLGSKIFSHTYERSVSILISLRQDIFFKISTGLLRLPTSNNFCVNLSPELNSDTEPWICLYFGEAIETFILSIGQFYPTNSLFPTLKLFICLSIVSSSFASGLTKSLSLGQKPKRVKSLSTKSKRRIFSFR